MERADEPMLFDDGGRVGTRIGSRLVLFGADGRRAVFLGGVAIYVYEVGDKAAESSLIAMLSRAELASDVAIGEAFGCHRNTVGRLTRRLVQDGMAGVVPAKRGPKAAHKVTAEVLEVVESERGRMSVPALTRLIADRTGVVLSVSHVRRLVAAQPAQLDLTGEVESERISASNEDDGAGSWPETGRGEGHDQHGAGAEDATTGGEEASLEPHGVDDGDVTVGWDPPAVSPRRSAGRYMGLALYYPAIEALGLLEVARRSFRLPRSSVFGVRAVMLSVFFMTLLRKTTLESAKHLRRAEFGR